MTKMNVFTSSWGQLEGRSSNMGDTLIFEAILQMLNSLVPVKDIFCYSSEVTYTNTKYNVHSENPFTFQGLCKTIRNIVRSDLVLLGGGELVQTRSSFLYLIANLAPALLAGLSGKRCLAIGAGIGDMQEISWMGKALAKLILRRLDCVCVRDRASLRNALSLGLDHERILLTADLAYHFVSRFTNRSHPSNNRVLFSPRFTMARKGSLLPSSLTRNLWLNNYEKAYDASVSAFAHLLDKLARKYDVVLFPSYSGKRFSHDDHSFARKIHQRAGMPKNVEIYSGPVTSANIFEVFKSTFVTIGVPLHSLIISSIIGNPIIAIAYSSKIKNLMDELSLTNFIIDISKSYDNLDAEYVLEFVDKCKYERDAFSDTVKDRVKNLYQRNELNYFAIKSAIDKV